MADRCEHCSVRKDGLEVHADDCPVRGPEIREENDALELQVEELQEEIEELKTEKDMLNLQIQEQQKEIESYKRQLSEWYDKLQGTDANWKESVRLINTFPEIVEALAMEAFLAARKIRLPGATDAFASDVKAAVEAKAKELLTPAERPFTTETLKALQDSPHKAPEEPYTEKRIVSRTNLERYLAVSMQMLMARADGRNEDSYLDQLDKLDEHLTENEKEFLKEMGKDWATR